MASLELNDSVILSDYGKPYIVAELNTSHFGKVETAKLMIDKAKEAGCDCVKFQSWTADTLYSQNYYDENPIAKRFIKKFSLSPLELEEVLHYCRSSNIGFSSTPYSCDEVDFLLKKCDVPYLKVASMDLNNLQYLKDIAESGWNVASASSNVTLFTSFHPAQNSTTTTPLAIALSKFLSVNSLT